MEAIQCIRGRRSVRRFTGEKVPHGTIEAIVETARYAPTWKNTQTARYLVIENRETLERIADECTAGSAHNTGIIREVPALVVLSYVEKRSGYERDGSFTTSKGDAWEMFDAGIAAQTFCLAAYEKGVGTCIMGIFDEELVAKAVGLPEGQRVGALIAVGYPEGEPAAPARKEAAELLSFDE
ncbi:MAG: nitroreductase family protein [Eubacteriales bacterium]|nr:nitroreductase family protein [Eubacteriales bacterium]